MDVLDSFSAILGWFLWLIPIFLLLVSYKLVLRLFGAVIIPEDSIGIVNKRFVLFGANRRLPDGSIVALNGEAGYQADTLAPGLHFFLWPWQYVVKVAKFTNVKENFVGVVEARDGKPLSGGRVLGKAVNCDAYQDARAFLQSGGERGPQITIIPPGTYRINTTLFTVQEYPVLDIPDNMVGVVTTKEGAPLATGDIAGPEVAGHNTFQDGQAFVNNGGMKGLQTQVMLAGRYFVNPHFVAVETKPMTEVPIAHVGVVIAYVGDAGVDVSGAEFKHATLVSRGQRGVWNEPLDPGKYPINPYTHRVELVPTANIVLNWAEGKSEAHKLDANLSTITVRSGDGFTFNLDVSQIIHIPRGAAAMVIAQFGSVVNLVTQVLEPTIGNYFRNAAQSSDVIDFLRSRSERQEEAKTKIKAAVESYGVGAADTLIGDINPPEQLMRTLTDRKIAEQEQVTYKTQMAAQTVRRDLQQATALADTQVRVVDAERTVQIAKFGAEAAVETATGAAKSRTIMAEADAQVTRVTGDADAAKITAVGSAEADVIKQKITSMEAGNYAAIQVAEALAKSGFKLVPDVVAGGGDGSGNPLMTVLMGLLVHDKMVDDKKAAS